MAEYERTPQKSIGKSRDVVKRSDRGRTSEPLLRLWKREEAVYGFSTAYSEGVVGLLLARAWQPGFGYDAPDLLPLRVGDAPEWGTDVGLVDPAQDGQGLLHSVVPVEERLGVGRLHHGVDSAGLTS